MTTDSVKTRPGLTCARCRLSISSGQETTVCPDCGGVHHWRCWQAQAGCSIEECRSRAAGRIEGGESSVVDAVPITISEADLDRAIPLKIVYPARDQAVGGRSGQGRDRGERESKRPLSGLAVGSFVTAVVGLPLFGLATGLVAVVLGLMAASNLRTKRQRGIGFAAAGMLLGVIDVVAWGAAVVYVLGPTVPTSRASVEDLEFDESVLPDMKPPLRRAMQANVLIQIRDVGWLGGTSLGSGVVLKVDKQTAWILTNRHVVDPDYTDRTNAAARGDALRGSIQVKMVGQPSQPGTVLWTAPDGVDLAVIQTTVLSDAVQPADWQRGLNPAIGDQVFAVGNPQGLGWTHTQGSISQFRQQPKGTRDVRMIQTSTAINPGNSGGGLYDEQGRLIGINTSTIDKRVGEGLSFAIAFNTFLEFEVPFLHPAPGGPGAIAP